MTFGSAIEMYPPIAISLDLRIALIGFGEIDVSALENLKKTNSKIVYFINIIPFVVLTEPRQCRILSICADR